MPENLFPDEDLAEVRQDFADTLFEPCQVYRPKRGAPARGGGPGAPAAPTLVDDTFCRIEAGVSASIFGANGEATYASRLAGRRPYTIYLPYFGDDSKVPQLEDYCMVRGQKFDIIDVITGYTWQFQVEVVATQPAPNTSA